MYQSTVTRIREGYHIFGVSKIIRTIMKLSTPAAIILAATSSTLRGAAARSIVSPLSGINLFPQATFEVEVDAAHANSVGGLGSRYGRRGLTRAYGMASIHLSLLNQIQQRLGTDIFNATASGEVFQVQTLRLTETSAWHTDCEVGRHQKRTSPKQDELQVSFFFGNTNEDAYFETKDGDLCIPIVEGNFVSFDGRLPHRTVVMSGHIDMVGPFSLSSEGLFSVHAFMRLEGKVRGFEYGKTRRQLSAKDGSNIEGRLLIGDITDREKYPTDHFLKLNATGLPSNCTDDCGIAIALANSLECTKDVYDSALKVLLPKALFYSTDEVGSTNGWFDQFFDNLENENSPISLSEVLSMADVAAGMMMDLLSNTHFAPVVYLYDKEKVPVACAYLESLSDEEKEVLDTIFNEEEDDADVTESDPSDAAAAGAVVGGNGSGGIALNVPKFAVSMITAGALILISL